MNKILFLHIPKTSGTSLKRFLNERITDFFIQANSRYQLEQRDPLLGRVRDLDDIRRILGEHAGLALHVDADFGPRHESTNFRSLAWILFDPANAEYFRDITVIAMLREPFRRFLSEATFISDKQRAEPDFLPDFDVLDADAHLERVPSNTVLHFLLAQDLHSHRAYSRDDLSHVQACIRDYPIHVGIYERFEESIDYFSRVIGYEFRHSDLPAYNVRKNAPAVPPGLEERFRERHALDVELYDFALGLFDERVQSPGITEKPHSGKD